MQPHRGAVREVPTLHACMRLSCVPVLATTLDNIFHPAPLVQVCADCRTSTHINPHLHTSVERDTFYRCHPYHARGTFRQTHFFSVLTAEIKLVSTLKCSHMCSHAPTCVHSHAPTCVHSHAPTCVCYCRAGVFTHMRPRPHGLIAIAQVCSLTCAHAHMCLLPSRRWHSRTNSHSSGLPTSGLQRSSFSSRLNAPRGLRLVTVPLAR